MSGSSLDLRSSSQNASPVGSFQPAVVRRKPTSSASARHFEKGHRPCRSMGNSELLQFRLKIADIEIHSAKDLSIDSPSESLKNGAAPSNNFCFSLDKGLDVFEDLKRAEERHRPKSMVARQRVDSVPSHEHRPKLSVGSYDEGSQEQFIQIWQDIPTCLDEFANPANGLTDKSSLHEFSDPSPGFKYVLDVFDSTDVECSVNRRSQPIDTNYLCEPRVEKQYASSAETCDSYMTACEKLECSIEGMETGELCLESAGKLRLEDSVFASVASRTAALASRTTSFNLVRSRRGSVLDDGPS